MNRKRSFLSGNYSGRDLAKQFGVDLFSGCFIACGIYNFASAAGFPMAGVSGISLIFHRLFGTPIGGMSLLLNVPIVLAMLFEHWERRFLPDHFERFWWFRFSQITEHRCCRFIRGIACWRQLQQVVLTGIGYALVFRNQKFSHRRNGFL